MAEFITKFVDVLAPLEIAVDHLRGENSIFHRELLPVFIVKKKIGKS